MIDPMPSVRSATTEAMAQTIGPRRPAGRPRSSRTGRPRGRVAPEDVLDQSRGTCIRLPSGCEMNISPTGMARWPSGLGDDGEPGVPGSLDAGDCRRVHGRASAAFRHLDGPSLSRRMGAPNSQAARPDGQSGPSAAGSISRRATSHPRVWTFALVYRCLMPVAGGSVASRRRVGGPSRRGRTRPSACLPRPRRGGELERRAGALDPFAS
jgi:hypothetical protein